MKPEQAKQLRDPFPPELVGKLPKAGITLDYVGHAATTDRLLQVDPEWTWEPMALGPNGEPLIVDGGLWIRLTVAGVTRPGWGDGKNVKEMIGDAIRNAAMRFGVALDLWAKEDLHAAGEERGTAAAKPEKTPPAEAAAKKPRPVDEDTPSGDAKVSKKQAEEIFGLLIQLQDRAAIHPDSFTKGLEKSYGVTAIKDLTVEQADNLQTRLEAKVKAAGEQTKFVAPGQAA